MKKLFLLFILYFIRLIAFTQLPVEDVGNPATPTSVSRYTGWRNQDTLTFSGNAEVQSLEPSNNRLGSGGGNIFFTNTVGTYFEMAGFPSTFQPPQFEIIFGMHNFDTTKLNELLLEYSFDGTNYLPLPYKRYLAELYPIAPWSSMGASIITNDTLHPEDLRLRFTQTSATKQFRIDDIWITYYYTLSIKLQQFTSALNENSVQLSWTASSGSSLEMFSIEKSIDGINFTSLAEQHAKGTGTFNYSFNDPSPLTAATYYRLKMRNEDGSYSYSNILPVQPKLTSKNSLQKVYPLPAKEKLNIQIQSSQTKKAEISITDISGKTVITKSVSLATGANNTFINVQSLSKGVYFLKIVTAQKTETRKIVVGQ